MKLYTIHPPLEEKMPRIIKEVKKLGVPQIRVVDCVDHYMAIEGTHRLAACHKMGIAPELIVLRWRDLVDIDSLDIHYGSPGNAYIAIEITADLRSTENECYEIDDKGLLHKT